MKKTGMFILAAVFILTSVAYTTDRDKIAVAIEEKTTAADVSGIAARSPYFLLFDRDGKLLEIVDNPHQSVSRKAWTLIVPFLLQKGITFIVAGKFGVNMIRAMEENGIGYLEFEGSAEAALQRVLVADK